MELKGKKAIITGSSRGIGAGIATMFAKEGVDVVVNYNKDEEGAAKVKKDVEKISRKCVVVKADVSKEKEAKSLVNRSLKEFGHIDILVNNAGGALKVPEGSFLDMPMDYWRSQIELNLNAAVYCSHYLLKDMVKNKVKGKIINIGSVHSELTFSTRKTIPYGPAKAGLNMLTKCLATEFAKYGVNANCIAPGLIVTKATRGRYSDEWWDIAMKRIPLARAGTLEDVANLAVFLASDKSSYITGQTIFIDGGYLVDGVYYSMLDKKVGDL
ncbi:Glucose 1-dehydrogenase 2 [subsurface metagenome]